MVPISLIVIAAYALLHNKFRQNSRDLQGFVKIQQYSHITLPNRVFLLAFGNATHLSGTKIVDIQHINNITEWKHPAITFPNLII